MAQSNDIKYTLSEEFMNDYKKYAEQVDETGKNLFNGEKLNKLREDFFAKYSDYMKSFPFYTSWSKFPNCGYYETVAEDKKIITSDTTTNNNNNNNNQNVPEYAKVLGQVYWRACGSLYFYVTLVESRDNIKLDQLEAVQLGRYAIRYDPTCFIIHKWFMISK